MWKITFLLLDVISTKSRRTLSDSTVPSSMGASSELAWDESKSLALQWIGSILKEFLVTKMMLLQTFTEAWKVFVSHIHDTVLLDQWSLSTPVLQCLDKAVDSLLATNEDLQPCDHHLSLMSSRQPPQHACMHTR